MASSCVTFILFIIASLLLLPSLTFGSSGKYQSPIDITDSKTFVNKTLKPLKGNYHVYNASLFTDGEHLQVLFGAKGGLIINGKKYNLKQMHWHTPSEHLLNGVRYAAELHQVHVAADGTATVVGIVLKEGPPNPLLTMLKPEIEEVLKKLECKYPNVTARIRRFESSFLKRRPRPYYRYTGSFTTPPYSPNLLWNVLAKVKTISKDQVGLLKATVCGKYKKNARPTQPLNGRIVHKYVGK